MPNKVKKNFILIAVCIALAPWSCGKRQERNDSPPRPETKPAAPAAQDAGVRPEPQGSQLTFGALQDIGELSLSSLAFTSLSKISEKQFLLLGDAGKSWTYEVDSRALVEVPAVLELPANARLISLPGEIFWIVGDGRIARRGPVSQAVEGAAIPLLEIKPLDFTVSKNDTLLGVSADALFLRNGANVLRVMFAAQGEASLVVDSVRWPPHADGAAVAAGSLTAHAFWVADDKKLHVVEWKPAADGKSTGEFVRKKATVAFQGLDSTIKGLGLFFTPGTLVPFGETLALTAQGFFSTRTIATKVTDPQAKPGPQQTATMPPEVAGVIPDPTWESVIKSVVTERCVKCHATFVSRAGVLAKRGGALSHLQAKTMPLVDSRQAAEFTETERNGLMEWLTNAK